MRAVYVLTITDQRQRCMKSETHCMRSTNIHNSKSLYVGLGAVGKRGNDVPAGQKGSHACLIRQDTTSSCAAKAMQAETLRSGSTERGSPCQTMTRIKCRMVPPTHSNACQSGEGPSKSCNAYTWWRVPQMRVPSTNSMFATHIDVESRDECTKWTAKYACVKGSHTCRWHASSSLIAHSSAQTDSSHASQMIPRQCNTESIPRSPYLLGLIAHEEE